VAQNKAKVVNFNADARAEERGKGNVFIGGKTFHPRKRTTRLMSEWADVLPNAEEIELARKAQDDDDPKGANEAAKRSMRENPVIAARPAESAGGVGGGGGWRWSGKRLKRPPWNSYFEQMAILARYGNVQPNVYDEMDPDEAFELAERVAKMWRDDVEELMKAQIENTKAILKQIASRPSL
jgi:hypothetical protein